MRLRPTPCDKLVRMYTPLCTKCRAPRKEGATRCEQCTVAPDLAQLAKLPDTTQFVRALEHRPSTGWLFKVCVALVMSGSCVVVMILYRARLTWAGAIVPLFLAAIFGFAAVYGVKKGLRRPWPRAATIVGAARIQRSRATNVTLAFADGSEGSYWTEDSIADDQVGAAVIAFIDLDRLYETWLAEPAATAS